MTFPTAHTSRPALPGMAGPLVAFRFPGWAFLFPAWLAGCGTVGLDKAGTDTDSGAINPVLIRSLDPSWAPTEGGTMVTVVGAGFEGEVAFWFGGTSVDVTVVDDETLVVLTPEVRVEATVDVRVDSDLGSYTLGDGFAFAEEEPDTGDTSDSGDTGDSGDTDDSGDSGEDTGSAAGLIGGMVELDYLVIACPSCFGYTSAEQVQVDAAAVFHEPSSDGWADWLPPNGSCTTSVSRTSPSEASLDVGRYVYLEYGSSLSIGLNRTTDSSGTYYASSGLSQSDYIRNASFDLIVSDGGDLGPFDVNGVLRTTSGFDTITPLNMLNDGTTAFATMRASNAAFTWSPTSVSDAVIIDMLVFDSSGSSLLAEIFCASDDNGAATIPNTAFSGLPAGALAAIYFYRWEEGEVTHPVNGSTIQSVTIFGALGTATLVP